MGGVEESVVRSARVLAAFLSQDEAVAFAQLFAIDPKAFYARWQPLAGRTGAVVPNPAPPRIEDLPASAKDYVDELRSAITDSQPLEFKMVELGRLIAFQSWLDTDASTNLCGGGATTMPTEEEILRICLPRKIHAPTRWLQAPNGVTVCSQDTALHVFGPTVNTETGTVTFSVRPKSNLLLVREHAGRYVLANGHHRAWSLRSRGVAMVPAVIVHHGTQDQVHQGGGFSKGVLFGERPPLVDHFLDDNLTLSVEVRAVVKVVRLTAEVSVIPRLV